MYDLHRKSWSRARNPTAHAAAYTAAAADVVFLSVVAQNSVASKALA